jgi:hypothetical protein
VDGQTSYLFIVKESYPAGVKGDMPRGKQFGYLFTNSITEDMGRVTAHETGHGIFKLRHPFDEFNLAQNALPDNLLDYGTGEKLVKYQWDAIHAPGIVISLFESDKDGELCTVSPSVFISKGMGNADGSLTFISQSGKLITLPPDVKSVNFSTYDSYLKLNEKSEEVVANRIPIGTLHSFITADNKFYAGKTNYTNFEGYYAFGPDKKLDINQPFKEDRTKNLSASSGIVVLATVEYGNFTGYAGKFSAPTAHDYTTEHRGDGALMQNLFAVPFAVTDLKKPYKDYFSGKSVVPFARIPELDFSFGTFAGINAGNPALSPENLLKQFLGTQSTLAEVLGYLSLVYKGNKALAAFTSCLQTGQATLDPQQVAAIKAKFKASLESDGLILDFLESAGYNGNDETELLKSLDWILADVVRRNSTAASAEEFMTFVKANPGEGIKLINEVRYKGSGCLYKVIDLATRKILLDALISYTFKFDHDNYWSSLTTDWEAYRKAVINNTYLLIAETPADQQPALLQLLQANDYELLRKVWDNNDLKSMYPVLSVITDVLKNNFFNIKVPVTYETVNFINIPGLAPNKIAAGRIPILLSKEDEVPCISVTGNRALTGKSYLDFTDEGKIKLQQELKVFASEFQVNNMPPVINNTGKYLRSGEFDPFEPLTAIVAKDIESVGLKAGQRIEGPAIWIMLLQRTVRKTENDEEIRRYISLYTDAMIAGATFGVTGTSLSLWTIVRQLNGAAALVNLGATATGTDLGKTWHEFRDFLMIADMLSGPAEVALRTAFAKGAAANWEKLNTELVSANVSNEVRAEVQAAVDKVKAAGTQLGDISFTMPQVAKNVTRKGITEIGGIQFRQADNYIDVIIHYDRGSYVIWIDGSRKLVNENTLAQILSESVPGNKTIRLLSCSDLTSAERLSLQMGDRNFLASADELYLYGDGTVEGGVWYNVKGKVRTPAANATPPLANTVKSVYVKLGQNSSAAWTLEDAVAVMREDFPRSWKFTKISEEAYEVADGIGRKWATVYKDKIIAPARTVAGTPGNPVLNKVPLANKTVYDVDGLLFQTDDLGRVLETTADLDDLVRVRLGNQQIRAVDVKDGIRGEDQGGHIVASRFFGPGEQINMYPMAANLNLSGWKQMENTWADAMVAGKDVKVKIRASYEGNLQRPVAFEVEFWIDGVKSKRTFINQ